MKKISIAVTMAMALFAGACSDITDIPPADALSSASIFTDSTNIELAVVGLYNSVQGQIFGYNAGGDNRGYPFGSAHIEQGEMRGEDLVNTQGFYAVVYLNTQTSSAPNVVNFWAGLFEVVNQANTLIAGLSSTTAISTTRANSFIAEARFLRAMAYHELALFYCKPYGDSPSTNPGVPFHDVPAQLDVDAATAIPRGTVADIYAHILNDLNYASANLPTERSDNQVTRATKGAALALKSRVYLHQQNWAKVKATADSVIALGEYTLGGSPDAAFTNNTSSESIFSIEWSSTDQGSVNGGIGSAFLPASSGGRGLIGVSPNLYNAPFWLPTDKRRSLFLVQDEDDQTYYIQKYKDPNTNTDFTPIIRLPELLLNEAEAIARLNTAAPDPAALALLNQVRGRAVAAADNYVIADFTTSNELVQAILNERRIELIGEGFRWPDISRLTVDPIVLLRPVAEPSTYGIPMKLLFADYDNTSYSAASGDIVQGSVDPIPYSDHRFIYPISNIELANNPTIGQNPGY